MLQRPTRQPKLSRITQSQQPDDDWDDPGGAWQDKSKSPSRVLETGPGALV